MTTLAVTDNGSLTTVHNICIDTANSSLKRQLCRLQDIYGPEAGEVDMAIVAASNLYLNPDHMMDMGSVGQAHSPTALCHSFDADADGYCKAEAVGCLLVKRLSDAVRDRDPIRGIVRGTASNSNGRTRGTGGIAQPSGEMQAAAIRNAYANAGITNFNETAFLECRGTGTPAGDPEEVHGVGSVFSLTRDAQRPLVIGSVSWCPKFQIPVPVRVRVRV